MKTKCENCGVQVDNEKVCEDCSEPRDKDWDNQLERENDERLDAYFNLK
jgi:uncharacterized OB-fold protein